MAITEQPESPTLKMMAITEQPESPTLNNDGYYRTTRVTYSK